MHIHVYGETKVKNKRNNDLNHIEQKFKIFYYFINFVTNFFVVKLCLNIHYCYQLVIYKQFFFVLFMLDKYILEK